MSDEFEIRNPDGERPEIEELAAAMEFVARAQEHEMSCPVLDCPGKIEAKAPFWIAIAPDGRPSLDGIGWFENGHITCSVGGEEHVPQELYQRLDDLLLQYCAQAETILGASKGEDLLAKKWENE